MSGSRDHHARHRATRAGRERGCSIYIDAETLRTAGVPVEGPPPYYRVWAGKRGGLFVRLYKER